MSKLIETIAYELEAFYGVFLPYATYPVDLGRYGQSTLPRWQHHKRMMQEYMVSVGIMIRGIR